MKDTRVVVVIAESEVTIYFILPYLFVHVQQVVKRVNNHYARNLFLLVPTVSLPYFHIHTQTLVSQMGILIIV